ncbi:thioesterase domain-containing protein, partial [Frankia sp. Cr1]|uniref:thioesterase domain-containing protein n=1 Tax=Frankia sp. Cr1 TaxID=3073931 RepID=UPI002AD50F65
DVRVIRRLQPAGPYTLWGYSFGARIAFETASQLERSGEQVENLFLIAPGAPRIRAVDEHANAVGRSYGDRTFLTILFSVFAGTIAGPLVAECLKKVDDEESFASFVSSNFADLEADLVRRIIRVVERTYQFTYEFHELTERWINAPITIFKARGDDYSFIENSGRYSSEAPTLIDLEADHYGILKAPGVDELVKMIHGRLGVDM